MVKRDIEILCLRLKLANLKRSKKAKINDIAARNEKLVNRIDTIEQLDSDFFDSIDEEIDKVKRLIKVKRNKKKKEKV